MNARDPLARHGEQTKGIAGAQVLLAGEGELRKIGERAQVLGPNTPGVKRAAIVGDVVVDLAQGLAQACQLQARDLVARGRFDRIEIAFAWRQVEHLLPPSSARNRPKARLPA